MLQSVGFCNFLSFFSLLAFTKHPQVSIDNNLLGGSFCVRIMLTDENQNLKRRENCVVRVAK